MPKLYPVYRFRNRNTGDHFYTIQESEVESALKEHIDYIFEGVAFYAYKSEPSLGVSTGGHE